VDRSASPGPGVLLDTDAWAREALSLLADQPGVRRVGLALSEGGGRRQRFTASDREDDAGLAWCHVDAYDDVPHNTVVRTGAPVAGSLDELEQRYPAFVEHQRGTPFVAVAAGPVVAAGQTLGGFVLYLDDVRAVRQSDLTALGERLGADLRRAQGTEVRRPGTLASEPVPPDAKVAVHEVPPDLRAAADARRFLRDTLVGWGLDDDTVDTAVLCLSELVTNALIHTDAGCELRTLLDRGVLTTTVRDGGTGGLERHDDDPLSVHGRGLQVVDALAAQWGSRLDSVGTTVWFVLGP
jgi:anti-sigma regulatory factor (Ser/Thr protein kinase)